MGRGGARDKPDPLKLKDPEKYDKKREKNKEAVKRSRDKQKMLDKALDVDIARETKIFEFRSKKIETIRCLMQLINESTGPHQSISVEDLKRQFFERVHNLVEEWRNINIPNIDRLLQATSQVHNYQNLQEIVAGIMDLVSKLFQIKLPEEQTNSINENP